jgi:hypothetical protein
MKLLTKITAISILTLSVFGIAKANSVVVPTDNYITSTLCAAAAQGNKAKLAREMKQAHLSKDFVTEEVKCNDLRFITFVEQYGNEVAEINGYVTNGKYRKEQKSSI